LPLFKIFQILDIVPLTLLKNCVRVLSNSQTSCQIMRIMLKIGKVRRLSTGK